MKTSPVHQESPKFIVHTLGRFNVFKDGMSVVLSASGSKKIWELYKFMLTHRDRSFTPESLMDMLWVSESYNDPRGTLRRQMHRLRQMLSEEGVNDSDKTLLYSNGYYKWNDLLDIEVDIDRFEALIKQGDLYKSSNPEHALNYYEEALGYYHGDYLPDCYDQHWVFAVRNHYKRLFLRTMVNTIEILKSKMRHDDIILFSQKAIKIDVYEEFFHLSLMEALMHKGQQKQALEHYEYITGFYYHEMGLKPSAEMRELYKKLLKTHAPISSEVNLIDALESNLSYLNAFYCEPSVFKSIYELERRRSERSGASISVAVIDAMPIEGYSQSQESLRINHLKQHLMEKLRKGDTFTLWNLNQFIVLLPGVDSEMMQSIMDRIIGCFPKSDRITVTQIKQLLPEHPIENVHLG